MEILLSLTIACLLLWILVEIPRKKSSRQAQYITHIKFAIKVTALSLMGAMIYVYIIRNDYISATLTLALTGLFAYRVVGDRVKNK